MVLVCADVRDPGNAGTVIRTADASGVDAVVCCEGTVDPTNPKTVRASAGSVFHTPIVMGGEARAVTADLRARGFRTVGTVVRDGTDYTRFDWNRRVAVVLGNEASGLPDAAGRLPRRAGLHPHGRTGGVPQRRGVGRGAVLRGAPPTAVGAGRVAAGGVGGPAVGGLYDSRHGCDDATRARHRGGSVMTDRTADGADRTADGADRTADGAADVPHAPDIDALVAEAATAIAGAGSVEEIRQVATAVSGKKSPLPGPSAPSARSTRTPAGSWAGASTRAGAPSKSGSSSVAPS